MEKYLKKVPTVNAAEVPKERKEVQLQVPKESNGRVGWELGLELLLC
jgi:hypothetical protein